MIACWQLSTLTGGFFIYAFFINEWLPTTSTPPTSVRLLAEGRTFASSRWRRLNSPEIRLLRTPAADSSTWWFANSHFHPNGWIFHLCQLHFHSLWTTSLLTPKDSRLRSWPRELTLGPLLDSPMIFSSVRTHTDGRRPFVPPLRSITSRTSLWTRDSLTSRRDVPSPLSRRLKILD